MGFLYLNMLPKVRFGDSYCGEVRREVLEMKKSEKPICREDLSIVRQLNRWQKITAARISPKSTEIEELTQVQEITRNIMLLGQKNERDLNMTWKLAKMAK